MSEKVALPAWVKRVGDYMSYLPGDKVYSPIKVVRMLDEKKQPLGEKKRTYVFDHMGRCTCPASVNNKECIHYKITRGIYHLLRCPACGCRGDIKAQFALSGYLHQGVQVVKVVCTFCDEARALTETEIPLVRAVLKGAYDAAHI